MSKPIENITEQKILGAAKVADVLRDRGVQLYRRGTSLIGLCPFHDDRHLGSFVVNERRNFYKCFSCGASGDAVTVLREMDGMTYPDALRYLASMYGIYIDDTPAPRAPKHEPRKPAAETTMLYWHVQICKPYMQHYAESNLMQWMLSLPFKDEHREMLKQMAELYCIGMSTKGATEGWSVFPQIDMQYRLRDMKLMAYKPDGHRDKEQRYSFNWMHSLLAKAGQFDAEKYHVEHCLFGLHLASIFREAEVCIVESEKSALICSAFSDPSEKIWMATGGKSGLNLQNIQPLIDARRYVVLYPDIDGYDEWRQRMDAIGYSRMSLSDKVREYHRPLIDGEKADMADIMVRLMCGIEETPAEVAARRLGRYDKVKELADFIQRFDAVIVD